MLIEFIGGFLKENKRFIRFCCVGASNLMISLITYYGLLYIDVYYQIANVIGFITGSLNGYLWNKKWVFKSQKHTFKSFVKFYISYLSTWLLSTILLYIWVEVLGISEFIAPILNVTITTPLNYILNKKWTFTNVNE